MMVPIVLVVAWRHLAGSLPNLRLRDPGVELLGSTRMDRSPVFHG
jgi:hypothetical protein